MELDPQALAAARARETIPHAIRYLQELSGFLWKQGSEFRANAIGEVIIELSTLAEAHPPPPPLRAEIEDCCVFTNGDSVLCSACPLRRVLDAKPPAHPLAEWLTLAAERKLATEGLRELYGAAEAFLDYRGGSDDAADNLTAALVHAARDLGSLDAASTAGAASDQDKPAHPLAPDDELRRERDLWRAEWEQISETARVLQEQRDAAETRASVAEDALEASESTLAAQVERVARAIYDTHAGKDTRPFNHAQDHIQALYRKFARAALDTAKPQPTPQDGATVSREEP